MTITWLGQGGFLFEEHEARIAVDPYLSDALAPKGLARLVPAPFTPDELAPSLVVFTHDHDDHFDPVTVEALGEAHPKCLYAGPRSTVTHAVDMGIDESRCTALAAGDSLNHGPFTLTATPAEHSGEAIGMVLEAEGLAVYVSGDTLYGEALAGEVLAVGSRPPDMAVVCINGRWGNMSDTEALKVVEKLRPRAATPDSSDSATAPGCPARAR